MLRPGQACPVTVGAIATNGYLSGLEFGEDPVHMVINDRGDPGRGRVVLGTTEQPGWLAVEHFLRIDPTYSGPVRVRGQRLDPAGPVRFGGTPTATEFIEPAGYDPNTNGPYRTPPATIWMRTPGCYGFQIDGLTFTQTVIIDGLPPASRP